MCASTSTIIPSRTPRCSARSPCWPIKRGEHRRRPRRARQRFRPAPALVDEVGYLSYSHRHADLLFELVSHNSTIITTNRPFAEWREVFPNAACVVSLVDRLVHNAEVLAIEAESYRLKEAQERADQRARQRRKAKS